MSAPKRHLWSLSEDKFQLFFPAESRTRGSWVYSIIILYSIFFFNKIRIFWIGGNVFKYFPMTLYTTLYIIYIIHPWLDFFLCEGRCNHGGEREKGGHRRIGKITGLQKFILVFYNYFYFTSCITNYLFLLLEAKPKGSHYPPHEIRLCSVERGRERGEWKEQDSSLQLLPGRAGMVRLCSQYPTVLVKLHINRDKHNHTLYWSRTREWNKEKIFSFNSVYLRGKSNPTWL